MEMTQMNTRLPVALKHDGDAVAKRHGKTPSDIVRAVWAYMAEHDEIPACAKDPAPSDPEVQRRLKAIEQKDQLMADFWRELGISSHGGERLTYQQMRDLMYEDMADGYEAL